MCSRRTRERGSFADRRLVRDGKAHSLPGKVVTLVRGTWVAILRSRAPKGRSSYDDGFLLMLGQLLVREQGVVEAQEVILHWSCGQHSSYLESMPFAPRKRSTSRLRRWRPVWPEG